MLNTFPNQIKHPVAIIGAGIGGLVAALTLHRLGVPSVVYESQKDVCQNKTPVALWANALRLLDRLGISSLRAYGLPTLKGEICSYKDGRPLCSLDFRQDLIGSLNEILVVNRADLRQLILERLPNDCVQFEKDFEGFKQNGDHVEVHVKNQPTFTASFLVGADGKSSKVRNMMGIRGRNSYAGYTLWRAVVDYSDSKIFPLYLAREIWGPGRRFGTMLLVPDKIYWYATCNAQENEIFLRPFRRTLCDRFENWPFDSTKLILETAEQDIVRYDVQDFSPMNFSWTDGRVGLLGDAAHPMTPTLHQGACMSIEDAFCLGQMISSKGTGNEDALKCYEEARKPRTLSFVANSRKIGRFAQLERGWQYRELVLGHVLLRSQLVRYSRYIGNTGLQFHAL